MNHDIVIAMAMAVPFGMVIFVFISLGVGAHLKTLRDKLRFFIWPYGPRKMLVIEQLEGSYQVLYDNEFSEINAGDKNFIKTIYGDQFVSDVGFEQVALSRSIYTSYGPDGYPSPMGVAWRWAVASAITIYMFYYAWVRSVYVLDMGLFIVTTLLFFMSLTYMLVNIYRMNDRTVKYAWFHVVGINPPHMKIEPSPALSNIPLIDYMKRIGREIVIVIGDDVKKIIEPIIDELKAKTGSRTLASIIISKLVSCGGYRQIAGEMAKDMHTIRKAGETIGMLRTQYKPQHTTAVAIITLIIGIIIGFGLGNIISIGVEPIPEEQTEITGMPSGSTIAPATPPAPPISNATVPQPAQPPPPPG